VDGVKGPPSTAELALDQAHLVCDQVLDRVGLHELVAHVIRLRVLVHADDVEARALVALRGATSLATQIEQQRLAHAAPFLARTRFNGRPATRSAARFATHTGP
jgi:hypothetical protein